MGLVQIIQNYDNFKWSLIAFADILVYSIDIQNQIYDIISV